MPTAKIINSSASILFFLAVFMYFWIVYPFHISYQEHYQMFLYNFSYMKETVSYPGGVAGYLSAFLTQFFLFPTAGALIVALLLGALQGLVWNAAKKLGASGLYYPLSFVPSLIYWSLMGDENYLPVGIVAPVLSLLCFYVYSRLNNDKCRLVSFLIITPLLFLADGVSFLLFSVISAIFEYTKVDKASETRLQTRQLVMLCLAWTFICFLFIPLILRNTGLMYPKSLLYFGVPFYRFPLLGISYPVFVYLFSLLLVPVLSAAVSSRFSTQKILLHSALYLIVAVSGGWLVHDMTNKEKEEVMAYDYYTYNRNWKKVLEMAEKKSPDSPLTVACLNLALCKQGLMADRMFNFYQNGTEGLLPSYTKDFTAPLVAAEIYYHIGFVNTAQRFTFEAMESIPNYNKSARAIKRLAETNIINGEYDVARKYLNLLSNTFFYKDWAAQALAAIEDESLIAQNEEWSYLRKYRTKKDFLFSEQELDMMLGFVFSQDETNRMAYEYLMAVCLLKKDLPSFVKYYPLGKKIGYNHIPISYQEALVYAWGLSHKDMKGIPYPISSAVMNNVNAYGRTYTSVQNAEPLLRKQFSGTYWYYLHYR